MGDAAMFGQPSRQEVYLSARYSSKDLRLPKDGRAVWRATSPKTLQCEECAWTQHEARGAFFPRRRVRHKREDNGFTLLLCAGHAELWKDRDAADSGIARKEKQK